MVRKLPQDPTDNVSNKAEEFAHKISSPQILPRSSQTEVTFASINLKRALR
jgi:hypothetical protein